MIPGCWKIAVLSFVPIFLASGNTDGFLQESKLMMRSLERGLEFLLKRQEDDTGDVALGVFVAQANLQWIYDRLKYYLTGYSWANERLAFLLNQTRDIIKSRSSEESITFGLLNESLWRNAALNLRYGLLNQHDVKFSLPGFDSCQSIDEYMMKGTPTDSDFCINELLSSNCKVSEYCWLSETSGGVHSGYKTSHRLLYFQVASQMNCQKINPKRFSDVGKIKKNLCEKMLLEASALFRKPTISLTRDLFMEQIALCGLEGYEEFAPRLWRTRVRHWQNFKGCFGLDLNSRPCSIEKNNSTILTKRTDSVVDDCHTHVTAVAISALAFFLRVTLKTAFNLP